MNEMIGENGWRIKKIGDISSINPDSLSMSTPSNLVIKYIDIESVKPGKILAYTDFEFKNAPSRARRIVKAGDIIVSTVRPYLRAFAYVTNEYDNCICSTGFVVLRTYEEYSANYLYQYVLSEQFMGQVLPLMVGSNYPAINNKDVTNITIHIPKSKKEQQKIAEILTTVDNNIGKTEVLIEKYKNIKQGMMQDLLTKGIDEHGNIRSEETHEFKDSPIGRIPTTWDDCLISDYISFQKSGLSRKISHEDIGVPVLTSSNIDNNSKLDVKELKYWYESDPQGANIADYVLEKGDILLCFINSIEQMGKLCIFDDIGRPCIYTTNLFRIKASTNTTPKFLYYLLLSHYVQNEIRVITKPAINQASFTKQDFAKTKVPLISVEEQAKIVEALDSANAKIETEIIHLNKLTLLKQGLMQDLLIGKVRVPLEEATG
ncbi:restriction endonuclease subunit S [Anaerosinus gibii]|uniref:Restriction endonuclease subunit S n=1 Tax=Selenobaculum gibii TaxID=3054208 RepID=A0A9Y2AJB5_9FIRM|nr:restriction endonuclease subunit S [Selenobaculum gbiensis]WIW71874.1 restriction endonuclease subunit S [Selenobaculum gbiensis]